MTYQLQWNSGLAIDFPVGRIFCVGRNYAEHARELDNPVPDEPVLFMKPFSALVPLEQPITIPAGRGEVHHEAEIAVLIGKPLHNADAKTARAAVHGVGLALDLTLRDLQNRLKADGLPWERAKAFDGSCPLSPFLETAAIKDLDALGIELKVNGETRQSCNTSQMLFPIDALIAHISEHFTLRPGDIVLTGTPAGVGPLQPGDSLEISLGDLLRVETSIRR